MILAFFRNLFRDLVRQPLRTFLTLSGVTWGTFAVILLLAFGTGIGKQQMKQFRGLGQSIILVFPGQTTMAFNGLPKGRPIQVTPDELRLVRERVPGIRTLSPEFISSRNIRFGREQLLNTVRGVDVPFESIRNTIPGQGRFINELDVQERRRNCFLGATIAKNLFQGMDPVGKQVMIEGVPFTVIGVMIEKDQNSNYNGQRDTHCAFIPWTTYMTLYGEKYVQNFIVQPNDPALSKQTIAALRNYLGDRLGFNAQDKDALFVWDFSDFERQFNVFFTAFNVFLGIIGAFTLLVGGVGMRRGRRDAAAGPRRPAHRLGQRNHGSRPVAVQQVGLRHPVPCRFFGWQRHCARYRLVGGHRPGIIQGRGFVVRSLGGFPRR